MATPALLTFPSNLFPVVPTFSGNGSKIEHPDLQIVFWGPYWPGSDQLTVDGLMQAVRSIVTGPYLDGLRQYGYVGPVNVRNPIVNRGNPNIAYPAPGPGVSQVQTILQAVRDLVDNLRSSNAMGDVSSNHELLVLVFLDPIVPFPQNFNPDGSLKGTVLGEHGKYEEFVLLAPNVRFAFGWIGTLPRNGLSAFDQATSTFSHELVESISNPFPPSGWVQTSPAAAANSGEIGDVCNNTACVLDSIVVQPYWGVQEGTCILPSGARNLYLNQAVTKHVPQDTPKQATVDMGPLCGSGTFDYVERDWDNTVAITAMHPGYDVPLYTWSINGIEMNPGNSTMTVPATWPKVPASVNLTLVGDHLQAAAREALSVTGHQTVVTPNFPAATATLRVGGGQLAPGLLNPVPPPLPPDPVHRNTATLRVTVFSSVMTVECGPGEGNASFSVGCQTIENWDSIVGTKVTTQIFNRVSVDMTNQEIVWSATYQKAYDDCYAKTHKAVGGGIVVVPRDPGDPGPGGLVERLKQFELTPQVDQVAQVVKSKLR